MSVPSPDPQIRPARPDEADALRELVRRAYQHYTPRIGREAAPMGADYARAIDDATVWVAEIDGRISGLIVARVEADHVFVDNVAVDPDLQAAGVGAALLRFAEQRARDLNLPEVRLYTNEKMTENLAYYPRRGFVEAGRFDADGFCRVLFRKRVPPRSVCEKPEVG